MTDPNEAIDYDCITVDVRHLTDDDLLTIEAGLRWLSTFPQSPMTAATLRSLADHAHDGAQARRYFRD
jgi:hypothetical protein